MFVRKSTKKRSKLEKTGYTNNVTDQSANVSWGCEFLIAWRVYGLGEKLGALANAHHPNCTVSKRKLATTIPIL